MSLNNRPVRVLRAIAIGVMILFIASCTIEDEPYYLYYLGGQSNMDGYGFVSDLPDSLLTGYQGIMIFHGNPVPDHDSTGGQGIWSELVPGHGAGFKSDGNENTYSSRFGPELTFARKIREFFPERRIAIVKYSRGGTAIDTSARSPAGCWEPDFLAGNGLNQYDHFIATMDNAFKTKDIDGDGKDDRLVPAGIIWMQGESDASNAKSAGLYEENLKKLIGLFRDKLGANVPVIIGRISDGLKSPVVNVWKFGDQVRAAQESFVLNDGNASIITETDLYVHSDPWHFDSFGYMDMGNKFGQQLFTIINN